MHHRQRSHVPFLATASKRWLAPLSLALLLAACGGVAPLPLSVTDLNPENGAVDVAVNVVLSATFDRAIDADTLEGAFTLATALGSDVAGTATLGANGLVATFTPDADLAYATTYTASIAGTVATTDGVEVGGEANFSFTTMNPATLSQAFSFQVENPDTLSGAIFAPVFETFGTFPTAPEGAVAPAQATAIRDAMDGATLALSGAVAGTLTPAAELSRINEVFGFLLGVSEIFFVPEGCDVTAENPADAAFASVLDLVVWDGTTLDVDGFPATFDGSLALGVVDGDVETSHILVASRVAWSAATDSPCELDPTSSYVLDLDVVPGWQFLRVTVDNTGGNQVLTFETLSLDDVAAAGVIGTAVPTGGPILLRADARRLAPIYR